MFKVVIADDEKKVIQLMQKLIDWEGAGYEIVGTANDGLTAISLVEELQPDLLVTDIRMPGCSGIELLKQAKEIKPDLLCIVVSGYREFEYAQSALKYGVEDYLLKPLNKNDMTELLHKIRAKLTNGAELEYQLRQNVIKKQELLISRLRDCAHTGKTLGSMEEVNSEYGLRFAEGLSAVILIKPDLEDALHRQPSYKILQEHILETVRKYISMTAEEWAAAVISEGIAVIVNTEEKEFGSLKKFCTKIRKETEQERDLFGKIRLTVCIGSVQGDFRELWRSMSSALYLCEDRLCRDRSVRLSEEEPVPETTHRMIKSGDRISLQNAIKMLSEENYVQALNQSFQEIILNGDLNGRILRNWYEDVIDLSLFQLNAFHVDGKRAKGILLEQFWQCSSPEELKENLKSQFCQYLSELREERDLQEAKPITEAKRYIREHYREALRLEDVSNAVGFNATYFSTLFKKETGMNYQDYLTDLRIGKAKELLVENGLSLADVAEQVGYTDLKYFSRLFKKSTGINPSEYKKLYS